jgi:hypothetical protein
MTMINKGFYYTIYLLEALAGLLSLTRKFYRG